MRGEILELPGKVQDVEGDALLDGIHTRVVAKAQVTEHVLVRLIHPPLLLDAHCALQVQHRRWQYKRCRLLSVRIPI